MRLVLTFAAAILATSGAFAQSAPMSDDPYIWLEDKDGAKPLAWVEAENARSLPRLQNDPRYKTFYDDALAIASAEDRIPMPQLLGGKIVNLWRDKTHPQGIWRWTTEADYAAAAPKWTTLIDLDALSAAEGKKWVWKGSVCLEPEERLCLVALSEGGEDAVTYREFDLAAGRFVEGGFVLPTSKQDVAWIDKDTLLVARDWGAGTLTRSGYAFVVKAVTRGKPLSEAREVFRGTPDDIAAAPVVFTDGAGRRAVTITRVKTFFTFENFLLLDGQPRRLPLPEKSILEGLVDGRLVVLTNEAWGNIPAGSLASIPLASAIDPKVQPATIFSPKDRQSVDRDNIALTRSGVFASIYDNVRGRGVVFTPSGAGWKARTLTLPDNLSVDVATISTQSSRAYVTIAGFTTPTRLMAFDTAGSAASAVVKALPARFDASGLVVEQFEARSTDGTKVPYFVVHRKDARLDGATPTIMTAYGGFGVSMTPYYSGTTGKLWLANGGAFVLANIRGGGELGPAWHEAGRKTKRQIVFDDFASVAQDLFARRITGAHKLGIYGGSNGGLLMGVEFTQHPELWKAVSIQVPLLDMLRYEQIAAGASWVDEYGSVSVPAERAFLAKISPYAALKRGVAYPEPFIMTTTKDDRVGPQHARKFAARMKEFGLPYLYYEDTAGGHTGDADIAQGARLQALTMTYFAQKLMAPQAASVAPAR